MSDGQTRTLYLPHGGTVEIPLPGSKARFAIKPSSVLADSGGSRLPTILLGLAVGFAMGAAVVWYWKR